MTSGNGALDGDFMVRVIDEALEGKREITDVAAEAGIQVATLRTWLAEHYQLFPEDPRHHKVGSTPPAKPATSQTTETEDDENDDDDDEGEDDEGEGGDPGGGDVSATGKRKYRRRRNKEEMAQIQEAVVAEMRALLEAGKPIVSKDLADKHGVKAAIVGKWKVFVGAPRHDRNPEDPRKPAVLAAIKAGEKTKDIQDRFGISASTIGKYRMEVEATRQRRLEALRKAREVKKAKMQDPGYREQVRQANWRNRERPPEGQLELPPASVTLQSRPAPPTGYSPPAYAPPASVPPSAPLARYEPPPEPPRSAVQSFATEALKECAEERATLRGMVTLLQREAEVNKRKLDAYRARYGEIQA